MSVRIHQLSKQIGMENKELIQLLRERGYEVKSASSTVDNISAESLVEEFGPKETAAPAAEEKKSETEVPKPKGPILPEGVIVKSKADIEREREARAAAEQSEIAKEAARVVSPPVAPKPVLPPKPSTPSVTISSPEPPRAPQVVKTTPPAPVNRLSGHSHYP